VAEELAEVSGKAAAPGRAEPSRAFQRGGLAVAAVGRRRYSRYVGASLSSVSCAANCRCGQA